MEEESHLFVSNIINHYPDFHFTFDLFYLFYMKILTLQCKILHFAGNDEKDDIALMCYILSIQIKIITGSSSFILSFQYFQFEFSILPVHIKVVGEEVPDKKVSEKVCVAERVENGVRNPPMVQCTRKQTQR